MGYTVAFRKFGAKDMSDCESVGMVSNSPCLFRLGSEMPPSNSIFFQMNFCNVATFSMMLRALSLGISIMEKGSFSRVGRGGSGI